MTAARVEAIYVATRGGAPMERRVEVEALAGRGLATDRYTSGKGHWAGTGECQVTLIEAEALEAIAATTELRVLHGEHRRNIVTRGLRLHQLAGQQLVVGDAVLAYDRPRPPCAYVQTLTQRGMTRALAGGRGGICARVVRSGSIREGARIRVLASSPTPR